MILHVAEPNKFTIPFFLFVQDNIAITGQEILTRGNLKEWPKEIVFPKRAGSTLKYILNLLIKGTKANKIIVHGLFDPKLVILLFFMPWLLKKCYWVILGGDLYFYQSKHLCLMWRIKELFRRPVIKNIGHLLTYIEGDVALAREWYSANGKYVECLMYPSNLYRECGSSPKTHNTINILVGNSADSSNNHLEVFDKLVFHKVHNIKIYVPLSYGDQVYAKTVIEAGTRMFGDKFIPLTDFITFEKYQELLNQIDIAVFNHKRQQAMGNTIMLLALGKTVYMRSDVTQWSLFAKLGITIYDVNNLCKDALLNPQKSNDNIKIVSEYFTELNLIKQWNGILND